MAFIVNESLTELVYGHVFPTLPGKINLLSDYQAGWELIKSLSLPDFQHVMAYFSIGNDWNQWQILLIQNSTQKISLTSTPSKKCCCGRSISQLCYIYNLINGNILLLGPDCLLKLVNTRLYWDYKIWKRLIRECAHCSTPTLVTSMLGRCCQACFEFRTSNYLGCGSCLKFGPGLADQCIPCKLGKQPVMNIHQISSEIYQEISELVSATASLAVGRAEELILQKHLELTTEAKQIAYSEFKPCLKCGAPINQKEQFKCEPFNLETCLKCLYPESSRCISCNKILVDSCGDKCKNCYKKLMRTCNKRQCNVCYKFEIPDLPGNEWKMTCYSCWKKSR